MAKPGLYSNIHAKRERIKAVSAHKTASEKARQKSFKARHAGNISKGKMSAAY